MNKSGVGVLDRENQEMATTLLAEREAIIADLRAGDLRFDYGYQRDRDKPKVAAMGREFSPLGLGVLLVSRRADGDYVMDGGHRTDAAILRNGSDYQLQCKVYLDLTPAEEALVFWLVNSKRGVVPTAKRYHAAFQAGNVEVRAICTALDEAKIAYSWTTGTDHGIICWVALHEIYRRDGVAHLGEVLQLIEGAWNSERPSLEAKFVKGASLLLRYHSKDEGWSLPEAVKRLSIVSAAQIDMDASERRSVRSQRHILPHHSLYESLHWFYNRGRRTHKLSDLRGR